MTGYGMDGIESNEAPETVLQLDPDKPIVLEMDVEEDLPAELEAFVRLSRLALYQEALDWFDQCLSRFSTVFPIMAEYAEMLLEGDFRMEFQALFKDISEDRWPITGIQDTDIEIASKLIELWREVGRLRWSDKPEKEVPDLQCYWDYLKLLWSERFSQHDMSETPLDLTPYSPILVQTVEVYLRLAVSLCEKGLLREEKYTNPPWTLPGSPPWAGFWRWYERLRCFDRHWEAQMIQRILLQVPESGEMLEQLRSDAKDLFHTARAEPPRKLDESRILSELVMSNNLCSHFLQNYPSRLKYARLLLETSIALKETLCTVSRDSLTERGKPILLVSDLAKACEQMEVEEETVGSTAPLQVAKPKFKCTNSNMVVAAIPDNSSDRADHLTETSSPMDPLSVTAGVVGIVVPALHISRLLLNDLKSIKDAPDNIKTLTDNIDSLTMALTSIRSIDDNEWRSLGPALIDNAKATITTSTATCERFSTDVQKWTKRSKDGSLCFLDRSMIGFFRQHHLISMSGEIQTCQTKITSVVSIVTLLKSIQQGQITDEIRRNIVVKSEELVKASQKAASETSEIEDKLKLFSLTSDPGNVEYEDTINQLKEQQKALESSQKLLEELLSKLKESARTRTSFGNNSIRSVTFGDNNSGLQLGLNTTPITFNAAK